MDTVSVVMRNKKTGLKIEIPNAKVTMEYARPSSKAVYINGCAFQIADDKPPVITFSCEGFTASQPIHKANPVDKEIWQYRFWKWFYRHFGK